MHIFFVSVVMSDVDFEVFEVQDTANGKPWSKVEMNGEWKESSAGGCYPNFMNWRNNPQYKLTIPNHTSSVRALLHLRRDTFEDNKGAIGFYVFKNTGMCTYIYPYLCVCVCVCLNAFVSQPLSLFTLGPADHKICVSDGDVIMRSEFVTAGDVVAEFTLHPITDDVEDGIVPHYIVVPCTYFPGVCHTFTMSLYSQLPLCFTKIPESLRWKSSVDVCGTWTERTSGGCRNFPSWKKNPTFSLECASNTRVLCVLSQPDPAAILPIGFYILNKDRKVCAKGPFMLAPEVFCDVVLDVESSPFSVVPCTFNPGQTGEFIFRTFTTSPLSLRANNTLPAGISS